MRVRILVAALALTLMAVFAPAAQAAAHKPFHCHYVHEKASMWSLWLPSWVLNCDHDWSR